ncbi:MAG: hypothetical protein OEZ13_13385 [Spirochaetia bacterium]|nr:hypothetical protein [Spirochaetia bacterium]
MRKFKFYAALIAGIFMLSATAVSATATKSAGMGLINPNSFADDYTWAVDGQLPYMYTNPAYISEFNKQIYSEINTLGAAMGGIMFEAMPALTLGVFVGTPTARTPVYAGGITASQGTVAPATGAMTGGFNNSGSNVFGGIEGGLAINPASVYTGAALGNPATRNLSLIFKYDLGKMPIGLGISYAWASEYSDDSYQNSDATLGFNNYEESVSLWHSELRIALGTILDLGGMKAGIAAEIRRGGIDNSYNYTREANASSLTPLAREDEATYTSNFLGDIYVNARISKKLSGNNMLHARLGLEFIDNTVEAAYSTNSAGGVDGDIGEYEDTIESSEMNIRFGLSEEFNFSKSVMAFVGFDFIYNRTPANTNTGLRSWSITEPVLGIPTTQSSDDVANTPNANTETVNTALLMPIFLGMEAKVTDNVQGRLGLRSNILNNTPSSSTEITPGTSATPTTVTQTTTNSTHADAGSTISFGLSYDIEQVSVDWVVNQQFFLRGPYFISGAGGWLATNFAVTYKFDGNKGGAPASP